MDLPNRQRNRLGNYDYSRCGSYFITICTANRKEVLSKIIVGTGVPDCPQIELLEFGKIAEKYIKQLNNYYDNISVDKYIIMPDHIHLILTIDDDAYIEKSESTKIDNSNSIIARFVGTFKRYCNKEYKNNIWQARYYDHVIRNQKDYNDTCEYIDANPVNWIIKNESQDI